tara:strand:+ start:4005 stop:4337 length:333 start_codon:yes stop_codon:yes gene_type:complete
MTVGTVHVCETQEDGRETQTVVYVTVFSMFVYIGFDAAVGMLHVIPKARHDLLNALLTRKVLRGDSALVSRTSRASMLAHPLRVIAAAPLVSLQYLRDTLRRRRGLDPAE